MLGLDSIEDLTKEASFLESILLKGIEEKSSDVLNFCKNNYYSLYLETIEGSYGTIQENKTIKEFYGD